MKFALQPLLSALLALTFGFGHGQAATVNWSAGIDHGFSLVDGTPLPAGSLVRIGWFRDPGTGAQLTDQQIQALAGDPSLLNSRFVEAGTSTIGSGVSGMTSHFTATSAVDTVGLGIVGKQIYLWVFDKATLAAATQQAICYWDVTDGTNPDGSPNRPGLRWVFPVQLPIPGTTSIDLTDLTIGSSTPGTGAKFVVGSFGVGSSPNTSAPNVALSVISSVLTINNASSLPTAVRNAAYSQTLEATGGTLPLAWSVSSGSLPDGILLNSSTGELSGMATTVGTYTFTIEVNDNASLVASKQLSLVVANSELAILTQSLADAVVDQEYNVTLMADGGTAPYAWSLTGGSLPVHLALGTDGIIRGTPTSTGTHNFQVTVLDQSGQRTEKSYSLVTGYTPTIEGNSVLAPGVRNLLYTHQFVIPDGRTYTWSVSNGALPVGMTLSSSGKLRGTSRAAGTFTFTITANGEANVTASRQFNLEIRETNVAPTVQPVNFPDTIVGNNGYRYQVVASPQPSKIIISGLPPGLRVDPSTGWVTGQAQTPGVFVASIRATNAAGSSPTQHATIRVKALPVGAVGNFNAIVAPVQEVNGLLGGRLDLTTTITGGYTLTLTQGSAVFRQKGILSTQVDSVSPRIISSIGNLRLNLILDAINDNLVGNISAVASNGAFIPASVTGWRQTWTPTNPSIHQEGYYSAGINLTSHIDIETVPQGAGWIAVSIKSPGQVTFTGRTASGDVLLCNSFLANNNRLLFHNRLNSNFGIMQGVLNLGVSNNGFESNTITGNLMWRKSTHRSYTYPTAFGPLNLAVSGGYLSSLYSRSVVWGKVFGLPEDATPSSLTFTKGGLAGASMNPSITPFTFSSGYVAHPSRPYYYITPGLPLPGSTFNLARTSLIISPNSGSVNGAFTLLDGTKKRVANYSGIIVRTPDGNLKAEGYFLLPKLLQFGEQGPPQSLSGKFTVTQP